MQEKKDKEPFNEKGGRSVPEREGDGRIDNGFGKSNDRPGRGEEAKKETNRRGTPMPDDEGDDE